MTDRHVTKTEKDNDGKILALCADGQVWSPRTTVDVINDIETHRHRYYLQKSGTERADIHVVPTAAGKYLSTHADRSSGNNLDQLLHF